MSKQTQTRHLLMLSGMVASLLVVLLSAGQANCAQRAPSTNAPAEFATGLTITILEEPGKISSPAQSGSSLASVHYPRHLHEGPKVLVDLSHPLHNGTLHWPKNSGFQYKVEVDAEKKSSSGEGYYVKSDGFSTAVHSGTHLDAPRHFSKNGWTVDQIPLERLIDVPLIVIDLSHKVKANRSYNFVRDDFVDSSTKESRVQPKSVVLIYTGISAFYDQGEKAYFGTDSKNISEMKIPGFSKEAAQFLVEEQIFGVGLDAPSADSSDRHGANEQYDPQAHTVFNSNNVYILENVSHKLKELVGSSALTRLTIAPLPIVNGSGSPVRLVAIVGHDDCHCPLGNTASTNTANSIGLCGLSIIMAAISYLIASRGLSVRCQSM